MKLINTMTADEVADIKIVFSDFDGVFTDNFVYTDENGKEHLRSSRLDGIGVSLLRDVQIDIIVISSEPNPTVLHRCKKMKIECYHNVHDKGDLIAKILKSRELGFDNAAFIGNDINDLSSHKVCAIKIGVSDSHADYLKECEYVTKRSGGFGAIRELCDHLYQMRKAKV